MKEDISNLEQHVIELHPALAEGIQVLGDHLQGFLQKGGRSSKKVTDLKRWLKKEVNNIHESKSLQNSRYEDLEYFLRAEVFEIVLAIEKCLQQELEHVQPRMLVKVLKDRIIDNCMQKKLLDGTLHDLLSVPSKKTSLENVEKWINKFVHSGKHTLLPLESQGLFIEHDLASLQILTQGFIDRTRNFAIRSVKKEQPDAEKTIQGNMLHLSLTFHTHTLGVNPDEDFAAAWSPYLPQSLAAAAFIGVGMKYDFPNGNIRMTLEIPLVRSSSIADEEGTSTL